MTKTHGSRKIYFAIAFLAIILVVALIFAYKIYFPSAYSSTSTRQWVPIEVNSENLPNVLESTSIIHDLPDESLISLIIGESKYILDKYSVVVGELANPDVKLTLPDEYFDIIGQVGICSALVRAQQRGDLGISFSGSTASLAWKYRALGKYRSCLGA